MVWVIEGHLLVVGKARCPELSRQRLWSPTFHDKEIGHEKRFTDE